MSSLAAVVSLASLGGVLFGLDQGNWAGAIEKDGFKNAFCSGNVNRMGTYEECHDESKLPMGYVSFLANGSSFVQFGAAIAALSVGPWLARRFGRRETLFVGSLIVVVGVVGQVVVVQVGLFLASRIAGGFGVGLVTYALPMYVSELVTDEVRGACGSMMQLTMVTGMVIASMLNSTSFVDYQMSFSLPLYPAIILAAGIFFMPQSPRHALSKAQEAGELQAGVEQARAALRRIRATEEEVEAELTELQASLANHVEEAPWSKLCSDPSIRKRVLVANALQWLQQLSGVNAILSYGPSIFESAGVPLDKMICALIVNICNLVCTAFLMGVIDKWGRRFLLLLSAFGMFVSMTTAAVAAHFLESMDSADPHRTLLGWVLLVAVCIFMSSFALGWGGVCWVYPAEIFPMDVKEKALSTSVCSQWIANFAIAFIVPYQVQWLNVSGTFSFYAVCLCFSLLYVYVCVPETKGLSVEDIDGLFKATAPRPSSPLAREVPLAANMHSNSELGVAGEFSRSVSCTMEDLMELAGGLKRQIVSMPANLNQTTTLPTSFGPSASFGGRPRASSLLSAATEGPASPRQRRPRRANTHLCMSRGGYVACV